MRTPGLFGGGPGASARAVVRDEGAASAADLGIGSLASLVSADQVAELRLAGGSGYGDPLERPIEAVQRDLRPATSRPRGRGAITAAWSGPTDASIQPPARRRADR